MADQIDIKIKTGCDWRFAALLAICAINQVPLTRQHKRVLQASIEIVNGSFGMVERNAIANHLNVRLDYLNTSASQLRKLKVIIDDEINPRIFNKNLESKHQGKIHIECL